MPTEGCNWIWIWSWSPKWIAIQRTHTTSWQWASPHSNCIVNSFTKVVVLGAQLPAPESPHLENPFDLWHVRFKLDFWTHVCLPIVQFALLLIGKIVAYCCAAWKCGERCKPVGVRKSWTQFAIFMRRSKANWKQPTRYSLVFTFCVGG